MNRNIAKIVQRVPINPSANTLQSHSTVVKTKKLALIDYHPEKAMATILQYSCLENPMDGGAW